MGRAIAAAVLAAVLAGVVPAAVAKDPPRAKGKPPLGPTPVASQVVMRRQSDLGTALKAAFAKVTGLAPTSGVAVVLDVTEAVKAAKPAIASALASLSTLADRPQAWQVAPLGGTLSAPVDDPAALGPALDAALAPTVTPTLDTLGMLRKTLEGAGGAGGVLLYLAHAHFEDGVDLEGFAEELRKAKRSFVVVGSEAAFERAWEDVLPTVEELLADRSRRTFRDVGRNPFSPDDPGAPWRGGDTACPPAPYLFRTTTRWRTAFRPRLDFDAMRRDPSRRLEALDRPEVAIPSSFGPYGLMRVCGLTGGCYVLWTWTSPARPPPSFVFDRCDLLPPDLRSRSEILSDLPQRPLALALMEAWRSLAVAGVLEHTPPWGSGEGHAMERTSGLGLWLLGVYKSAADRDQRVADITPRRDEMDRVIDALDDALRRAGEAKDAVDRRLRADADLLHQALETIRFRTEEFIRCSASIPPQSWTGEPADTPHLEDQIWIRGGDADAPVTARPLPLMDKERGARLLASRKAFLERYAGTPFGAIVAANDVYTFRLGWLDATPRPSRGQPGTGPDDK